MISQYTQCSSTLPKSTVTDTPATSPPASPTLGSPLISVVDLPRGEVFLRSPSADQARGVVVETLGICGAPAHQARPAALHDNAGALAEFFATMSGRGIVDTIRLKLWWSLHKKDRKRLIDHHGFDLMPTGPGRTLKGIFYPPTLKFVRHDGAQVISKGRYVAVEFSVPRILLGCNSRVTEVTPADLMTVIRKMTELLLPKTTAQARGREWWSAQRIDLAVDFLGSFERMAQAYLLARKWRVRAGPQQKKKDGSLYWRAKQMWSSLFITLYDKAAEVAHRARRARKEGGPRLPVLEPTGRLEVRLLNTRCRAMLTKLLEPCQEGEGLPFGGRRGAPLAWYRIDYARMHAFVHSEVMGLEGPPLPQRVRAMGAKRRALVDRASRFPGVLQHQPNARVRESIRRQAFDLALSRLGTRLSWLCWPGVDGCPVVAPCRGRSGRGTRPWPLAQ